MPSSRDLCDPVDFHGWRIDLRAEVRYRTAAAGDGGEVKRTGTTSLTTRATPHAPRRRGGRRRGRDGPLGRRQAGRSSQPCARCDWRQPLAVTPLGEAPGAAKAGPPDHKPGDSRTGAPPPIDRRRATEQRRTLARASSCGCARVVRWSARYDGRLPRSSGCFLGPYRKLRPDGILGLPAARMPDCPPGGGGGGRDTPALDPTRVLRLRPDAGRQERITARLAAAGVSPVAQIDYWADNGGVTYQDPDGREVVFASWIYSPPSRL